MGGRQWHFASVKEKSRFYVIFPAFCRLRRADLMYVYHYILAFKLDFVLEQRSTLNSECAS